MVDNELRKSLETAFIDKTVESNLALKPRFVSNNLLVGEKILSVIDDELSNCNEFAISVAFVTMGGITPLLQTITKSEPRLAHFLYYKRCFFCFRLWHWPKTPNFVSLNAARSEELICGRCFRHRQTSILIYKER